MVIKSGFINVYCKELTNAVRRLLVTFQDVTRKIQRSAMKTISFADQLLYQGLLQKNT